MGTDDGSQVLCRNTLEHLLKHNINTTNIYKDMKKLTLTLLALLISLSLNVVAKDKTPATIVTTTYDTDIHCENCSIKIMNNVPALGKGIKDVVVDIERKQVTVSYDSLKNNEQNIIKGFAKLHVNAVAAEKATKCYDTHGDATHNCCH